MNTIRDVLLGYLAWIESPSKQMSVAGLLVTNHRGIPIEFRYTDPVEITDEQRLLFGETNVTETLAVTMATSLWKSVEQKPRLLLMEDSAAAGLWEHLSRLGDVLVGSIEILPESLYLPARPGEAFVPTDEGGERMARVRVFPDAPAALRHVEELLAGAARKMRLDEPFERVEAILKAIHELPDSEHRRRHADSVGDVDVAPGPRRGSTVEPRRRSAPAKTPSMEEELAERLRHFNSRGHQARASEGRPEPKDSDEGPRTASVAARTSSLPRVERSPSPKPPTPDANIEREPGPDLEWWAKDRASRILRDEPAAAARAQTPSPEEPANRASGLRSRPDLQWMFRKRQG